MDDGTLPRSILIILLILASAFFSCAEASLSYCNRVRVKLQAEDGQRSARRVLYFLDHYDRTIASILIGNNVINMLAASSAAVLAMNVFGFAGAAAATLVITLLIFFLGEIIPKNIARLHPETLAYAFSLPLQILLVVCAPFSYLLEKIGSVVKKIIGSDERSVSMTGEDFQTIIEDAQEDGSLERENSELIQSALEFSGTIVSDIMTPAQNMVTIDIRSDVQEILQLVLAVKYSRIPFTDRGKIIGILNTRKYLKSCLHQFAPAIRPLLAPPTFIRAHTPVDTLFEDMRRNKLHMCIITDDDGQTLGLVTLEDILEEIVGDICDEDDPVGDEACPARTLSKNAAANSQAPLYGGAAL